MKHNQFINEISDSFNKMTQETNKKQQSELLINLINQLSDYFQNVEINVENRIYSICFKSIIIVYDYIEYFFQNIDTFKQIMIFFALFMKNKTKINLMDFQQDFEKYGNGINTLVNFILYLRKSLRGIESEDLNIAKEFFSNFISNDNWTPLITPEFLTNYILIIANNDCEKLVPIDNEVLRLLKPPKLSFDLYRVIVSSFALILTKIAIPYHITVSFLIKAIFDLDPIFIDIFIQNNGLLQLRFLIYNDISSLHEFLYLFTNKVLMFFLYDIICSVNKNGMTAESTNNNQIDDLKYRIYCNDKIDFEDFYDNQRYHCLKVFHSVVKELKADGLSIKNLFHILNYIENYKENAQESIEEWQQLVFNVRNIQNLQSDINKDELDAFMLKKFWDTDIGKIYFLNLQDEFVQYANSFFSKFERQHFFEVFAKNKSFVFLFQSMFKYDIDHFDEHFQWIQLFLNFFNSKDNEFHSLYTKAIKVIISMEFNFLQAILIRISDIELFEDIVLLSVDCNKEYFDNPKNSKQLKYSNKLQYAIFLRFSFNMCKKLLSQENFSKIIEIFSIDEELLKIVLFDKNVFEHDESAKIAIDIINERQIFSSYLNRFIFQILLFNSDENKAHISSTIQPLLISPFINSNTNYCDTLPIFLSITPNSVLLQNLVLSLHKSNFKSFFYLNLIPTKFVAKFLDDDDLFEIFDQYILSSSLRVWPDLIIKDDPEDNDTKEEDAFIEEFKNKKFEIKQKQLSYILKISKQNTNSSGMAVLIFSLLYICGYSKDQEDTIINFIFSMCKQLSKSSDILENDIPFQPEIIMSILLAEDYYTDFYKDIPFDDNQSSNKESTFLPEKITETTSFSFDCNSPFSSLSYTLTETISSNSSDLSSDLFQCKETIDPNGKVEFNNNNKNIHITIWKEFINSLLLINGSITGDKQCSDKISTTNMLMALSEKLFNENDDKKNNIDSNFFKIIFLGNPYEEFKMQREVLHMFAEIVLDPVKSNKFNDSFIDFLLDSIIEGWFVEKSGAVLNNIFQYFNKFNHEMNGKLNLAIKLTFLNIPKENRYIFVQIIRNDLFFSIATEEDLLFYIEQLKNYINEMDNSDTFDISSDCPFGSNTSETKATYQEMKQIIETKLNDFREQRAHDEKEKKIENEKKISYKLKKLMGINKEDTLFEEKTWDSIKENYISQITKEKNEYLTKLKEFRNQCKEKFDKIFDSIFAFISSHFISSKLISHNYKKLYFRSVVIDDLLSNYIIERELPELLSYPSFIDKEFIFHFGNKFHINQLNPCCDDLIIAFELINNIQSSKIIPIKISFTNTKINGSASIGPINGLGFFSEGKLDFIEGLSQTEISDDINLRLEYLQQVKAIFSNVKTFQKHFIYTVDKKNMNKIAKKFDQSFSFIDSNDISVLVSLPKGENIKQLLKSFQ